MSARCSEVKCHTAQAPAKGLLVGVAVRRDALLEVEKRFHSFNSITVFGFSPIPTLCAYYASFSCLH